MLVILHLHIRGGARLRGDLANLTPRMLLCVPRAPGQCVADEKKLHVVKGKGWQPGRDFWRKEKIQPVVHMVLTPLGVSSKSHSEASMVGQIFAKGEVPVHRGVGDGVIGILGGKAGLRSKLKEYLGGKTSRLAVKSADCLLVVKLSSNPLAETSFADVLI